METKSVFETLNKIDVSNHIEKKNGLSYLSWAWAWTEVKKAYPETTYKVYENVNGLNYHTDNQTAWVKVSVTIQEIECIEYLPIMNFRNQSIAVGTLSSMDVNKAIQRALTKAIARHGLGLYIYAGEDMPSEEVTIAKPKLNPPSKATDTEKATAWKDFKSICDTMEVDAQEFLSQDIDMTDKKSVYAEVRKWLGNEQLLRDQLIVYKQG